MQLSEMIHTVGIHLCMVQKSTKLIYQNKSQEIHSLGGKRPAVYERAYRKDLLILEMFAS